MGPARSLPGDESARRTTLRRSRFDAGSAALDQNWPASQKGALVTTPLQADWRAAALRRVFVVTRVRQARMRSSAAASYPETALIRPATLGSAVDGASEAADETRTGERA